MQFYIAETFIKALTRLDAASEKAARLTTLEIQINPASPGLQFHRIGRARDGGFWSVRANADVRIIVHKMQDSILLAYVDHHDAAYAWAERRRIEAHPRTRAMQIVELPSRIEDAPLPTPDAPRPFARLTEDELLGIGVPTDWIAPVRAASEDGFLALSEHLPGEAAEALLEYATSKRLPVAPVPVFADAAPPEPIKHPDAQRRFREIETPEDLARALDLPWERWLVFLHPTQRNVVDRAFNGPARVGGSAGTGKTVVALHRAARLARAAPDAPMLLTTFSRPLASALERRLAMLMGSVPPRVTVAPVSVVADELFQLAFGRRAVPATEEQMRDAVTKAAAEAGDTGYPPRFLWSEWERVFDAWQIDSVAAYAKVPRLGRRSRMSAGQRERLFPVFAAARERLSRRGLLTWAEIFGQVTAHYAATDNKPFKTIVVDEAQDLGVPELRLLAAIAAPGPDALFFAGDFGQRIFQPPFSWRELGVDVRGRSLGLTVNYRTSHQIRRVADRLLPRVVRDGDGLEEARDGTISLVNGPPPEIRLFASAEAETEGVAAWLRAALADGVAAPEIGVFVRGPAQVARARAAAAGAGMATIELSERDEAPDARLAIGTMHLAKGLEFKAVAVMACDDDVLPLRARIETVADEVDLDHVYETERHLFYVACTRARDRLLVSGVAPASEYFVDMEEAR